MPLISCPNCGEERRLRGERGDDGVTRITCEVCEAAFTRDPWTCEKCSSRRVYEERRPLYQKARGVQQSIIGYNVVRICSACGHVHALARGSEGYTSADS